MDEDSAHPETRETEAKTAAAAEEDTETEAKAGTLRHDSNQHFSSNFLISFTKIRCGLLEIGTTANLLCIHMEV